MTYQTIDGVRVWGNPDSGALSQAITCARHGNVVQALLMANHHKGYSQPIGECMAGADECGRMQSVKGLSRRDIDKPFLSDYDNP